MDAKAWVFAQGDNKTYDGTSAATLSFMGTPTAGGVVNLVDPGAGATFSDKNAAVGKTVTYSGFTLDGGDSGRFSLFGDGSGTTTATITARALTVTAASDTKTYDRTTGSVGMPTHAALQSGDTTTTFAQTFDNRNAGTGKTLTAAGIVNDGNSGNNYAYSFVTDTSGVINPLAVTLTAPGVTKTYDGGLAYTTLAGDLAALTTPLLSGDTVTAATIAYADRNAGSGNKAVNLNAATISDGNSGNNYAVTLAGNSTSTITALGITGSITAANKVYDATDAATITGRLLAGVLGTDDVSYSGGTA
ncbi:MAG: YDG domain-containing protein, partial [Gammaproteobacteria bacterium]|nr:YDG domain-containing protein [Gammaproteobacteria bacterium]